MPTDKRVRMMLMDQLQNPLSLLNLPGGNLDGVDSAAIATTGSFSDISFTMVYRHGAIPATGGGIVISSDSMGRGIQLQANSGQSAIRCYMYSGGGYRAYLDMPIVANSSNIISVSGGGDTGLNPTISATINGVPVGQISVITGTLVVNTRSIGAIGTCYPCKISRYSESRNGVQAPIYCPSKFGVYGSTNCGNGWTITDGSPTTFWT